MGQAPPPPPSRRRRACVHLHWTQKKAFQYRTAQHILEDGHDEDEYHERQQGQDLTARVDGCVRPGVEGFYLRTDLHIPGTEKK